MWSYPGLIVFLYNCWLARVQTNASMHIQSVPHWATWEMCHLTCQFTFAAAFVIYWVANACFDDCMHCQGGLEQYRKTPTRCVSPVYTCLIVVRLVWATAMHTIIGHCLSDCITSVSQYLTAYVIFFGSAPEYGPFCNLHWERCLTRLLVKTL